MNHYSPPLDGKMTLEIVMADTGIRCCEMFIFSANKKNLYAFSAGANDEYRGVYCITFDNIGVISYVAGTKQH